jgi:hypothetical protein
MSWVTHGPGDRFAISESDRLSFKIRLGGNGFASSPVIRSRNDG